MAHLTKIKHRHSMPLSSIILKFNLYRPVKRNPTIGDPILVHAHITVRTYRNNVHTGTDFRVFGCIGLALGMIATCQIPSPLDSFGLVLYRYV